MSKIKLTGSNSGYVEIDSAADAGNLTLTLPTSGVRLLSNTDNVFSGITTTAELDINGKIDVSTDIVGGRNLKVTGITTLSDDLTLTGASYNVLWDKSDNQLEFGDNAKLSFGAAADMQLYHNGTDSQIQNITGGLYIGNIAGNSNHVYISTRNNFVVQTNLNEAAIQCFANGGVELFYNSSLKLNTTNTGAIVTGICTATSFSGSGEGLTRTTQYSHRRINVNGAMVICQKATSVSGNADNGYPICTDMVNYRRTGSWSGTTWTVSQNSQTPTALAPFKFFTRWTQAGTAQNAPNNTSTSLQYKIEGRDMAHAMWGTSDAKQCTLSFYVRCSQTGTFCIWLTSTDTNYNYIIEYTISAANTWQRVTHTIPGPTSGTFNTDTSAGCGFYFQIAAHAASGTYGGGTKNVWNTSGRWTSNQSTAMSANAGATWDITGIQFEIGDIATPFEHRSFTEELSSCQRYFQQIEGYSDMVCAGPGRSNGTTHAPFTIPLSVPLRASPTVNACSWAVFTSNNQSNSASQTPAVTKWHAHNNVLTCQLAGLSGMTNGRALNVFLNSSNTFTMDANL
jgi:hypothetical protein